jgi:phosphopantetheinyl transferase
MVTARVPAPSAIAEVWWLHAHEIGPSIAGALLEHNDQRALARMHDDRRAATRRNARALLRVVAARHLRCDPGDVRIRRRCARCGSDEHGQPFVEGAPFALSTAITDDLAVAAVGGARIGVDVIARTDALSAFESAHAVLTTDAIDALDALPAGLREDAALSAVAQVEAYAKANGQALSAVAGAVPVSLDPLRPRIALPGISVVAARVDPDDAHVAVLVVDPAPAAVQVRHATRLFCSHVRSV